MDKPKHLKTNYFAPHLELLGQGSGEARTRGEEFRPLSPDFPPCGRGRLRGPSSGMRSAWQPGAGRPDPAARRLRELVVPGGAAVLSGAARSCSERLRVGAFAAFAGGPGLALLPLLRGRGRTVACHFPPGTLQRLFRTDRHAGRPFAGGVLGWEPRAAGGRSVASCSPGTPSAPRFSTEGV